VLRHGAMEQALTASFTPGAAAAVKTDAGELSSDQHGSKQLPRAPRGRDDATRRGAGAGLRPCARSCPPTGQERANHGIFCRWRLSIKRKQLYF